MARIVEPRDACHGIHNVLNSTEITPMMWPLQEIMSTASETRTAHICKIWLLSEKWLETRNYATVFAVKPSDESPRIVEKQAERVANPHSDRETEVSTLSLLERDRSDQLARRFALVTTAYFDEPGQARTPAARVPLENLFRMLQMLRYDAFSDERRSGILELESFDERLGAAAAEDIWHERIERALKSALSDVFGDMAKEQAVNELQSSLTWLATDGPAPDGDVRHRAKAFLERFIAALS